MSDEGKTFDELTNAEKDAAIAAQDSASNKMAALVYLNETDWYAWRKAETGTAIPGEVLTKRAQARLDASE